MAFRKLSTALPLLARLPLQIDQRVAIQPGEQYVELAYQGSLRGFQSFLTPLSTLLNTPEVQANVRMSLTIEFEASVSPTGKEMTDIQQTLNRNPVDRLNLTARVVY